jgi:tripartite-type tricarboxylate transporter receptor subunit TctC
MKRRVVFNGAASIGLYLGTCTAFGQVSAYPTKPVRLINGFAPGGAVDAVSRVIAERLATPLGQSLVVDNRPGAGGTIAAEALARSAPDGYTLGVLDMGALAVSPSLFPKLRYEVEKDFALGGLLARIPLILVVHPSMGVNSLRGLTENIRKNPGKFSYASAGIGSPLHLGMELYKRAIGGRVVHIPYRGAAPAVQDLLAGRIEMMLIDFNTAIQHIQAGSIRAIAAGTYQRLPRLPEVPTFAENGVEGVLTMPWLGLVAPSGIPGTVLSRISSNAREVMEHPETRQRIEQMGFIPLIPRQEEFQTTLRSDTQLYSRLIRELDLKME